MSYHFTSNSLPIKRKFNFFFYINNTYIYIYIILNFFFILIRNYIETIGNFKNECIGRKEYNVTKIKYFF